MVVTVVCLLTVFAEDGSDYFIYLPSIQKLEEPATQVSITKIFFDGLEFQLEGDEYVEIRNDGDKSVQLRDWTLRDLHDYHVFIFPNYLLQPDEVCRIYTNEMCPLWCGFSFMHDNGAVWNNDGDEARLQDSEGVIIDVCVYEAGGTTAVCE